MESQRSLLPSIEINPESTPIGSVILMHGLGANGNDFVPFVQELHLPRALPLRFVFPHAPVRAVTINNGYVMPAWYDILSLNIDQRADQGGMDESVEQINWLVDHEIQRGIAADKIILAGFSQGGVIALTTALRSKHKLAGVMALSTYLPNAEILVKDVSEANKHMPIFMAHGTQDPVVPYSMGESAYTILHRAGLDVSWHNYSMAHSVCDKEVHDIADWLKKIYS